MFFDGSLQDGIATALEQSKLVVCFVTDDGDESQLWENDFLTDAPLKSPLESQAVVLRLLAGSQEAGFLEALFPVPKKPTVVVIQNGQLKEYIADGTTKEEFVRRVGAALSTSASQNQQPAAATAPAGQTLQQTPPQVSATEDSLYDDDDGGDLPSQDAAQGPAPQVQSLLAERAKRLEADKKAKEAKAKAERERRAKERQQANESNEGQSSNVSAAERNYAQEVRQRKHQVAEERKRILKRIEDDRRERKEREAQERQARLLLSATQDGEGSSSHSQTQPLPLSRTATSGAHGDHCNLQVRLFDGSTIRHRFKGTRTLGRDVRRWVDRERTDGGGPYTFRVVLTPLPNKAIEREEENEPLSSLGLAPSATLVLVPTRYAVAYAQGSGILFRSLSFVFGVFRLGFGVLTGALGGISGMLFGRGAGGGGGARRRDPPEGGIPLGNLDNAARDDSRIRGFQNPDDRARDAQLYNGNSLNFEPRNDEDSGDKSN
ncbi:hypothetical protein F5B20DRAFT_551351 [Whalleya microplaca]|nr:hypothetical protein F5B20DRAFT_551351 [Whalleya microplaca]